MIKVKAFVFVCAGPAERMFGPNGELISLIASGWKAIATAESALLVRMLGWTSPALAVNRTRRRSRESNKNTLGRDNLSSKGHFHPIESRIERWMIIRCEKC